MISTMLSDQGNHYLKVLYVDYSFINNLLYSIMATYRLIIVHDFRLGRKSHIHLFIFIIHITSLNACTLGAQSHGSYAFSVYRMKFIGFIYS